MIEKMPRLGEVLAKFFLGLDLVFFRCRQRRAPSVGKGAFSCPIFFVPTTLRNNFQGVDLSTLLKINYMSDDVKYR